MIDKIELIALLENLVIDAETDTSEALANQILALQKNPDWQAEGELMVGFRGLKIKEPNVGMIRSLISAWQHFIGKKIKIQIYSLEDKKCQ